MTKRLLRWLVRFLYGFRAHNLDALQAPGPVLLVPNHVSWLDWLFVYVCLDEDWKFVVSRRSSERSWLHRKIMIHRRSFPIDTDSPYAVKRMAEFLGAQGRLVLFAEGRLSRTGTLMKLFDGTGFLLHKTGARVITCYLRGAQRLPFSPNRERHLLRPRVSAHFSPLLTPPPAKHLSNTQARTLLTHWLRDRLVTQQFEVEMEHGPSTLPAAILQTARQWPSHPVLQDINATVSYRRLLTGADLLSRALDRGIPAEQKRVGVLLPNVNAMPVVLLALWEAGRVPAVLNYTQGAATMLACLQLAGVRHVVTSRAFLEKARLKLDALHEAGLQFIYLEDLRASLGPAHKLTAALRARFRPEAALRHPASSPDPAVILFTSGSEGVPKAVELSHRNILANLRQMLAICDLQDWDRCFTALPTFHCFGLTVGTLLPLVRGCHVFLYPSPLHYRVVPTVFYDADCTILLATNTFLNGYARKAHPLDFRSLRYLFAGAEKLQQATFDTWAQRYGVRILEGYGATECSPCISVNTPLWPRHGSAGRLMPGMEGRLEPVEGVSEGGRLFVRGPNVMRGYLNPDANAAFQAREGWYDTGDIVRLDDEGYVFIQGRLKRFAKISGEMVSLTAVEDALAGAFPHYGLRLQIAVVSVPCPDKGEMLIAVTNEARLQIEEVRAAARARGLPNLAIPREIRFLREIPKLGTGKINHRELAKLL
ncbi:MAG: hypothetical protein RJA22_3119 [Verrucomicrobiota bacterium]|jgi:acyl-[acyl-carrier-protein]-phospholipid O-acyltransferase/long-chain-fatty-acid--[acyl-carrier-protein] ligase